MRLWFAGLLASISITGAHAAPPIEAYGKLPSIEEMEISPDGARIAFVATVGEDRRIVVQSLDGKLVRQIGLGTSKLRDLTWAGPDNLVLAISQTAVANGVTAPRSEWLQGQVADLTTGRLTRLTPPDEMTMNVMLDYPMVRTVEGKAVVYFSGIRFDNGIGRVTLYRFDTATRRVSQVERGSEGDRQWVVDGDGKAIGLIGYSEKEKRWTLRSKVSGAWKAVAGIDAPYDPPSVAGLGRRPHMIIVSRVNDGRQEWREMSLADGTWGEALSERVNSLIFDPVTRRVIGGASLDELSYQFFDPADQTQWRRIVQAFTDATVELVSWTDDRTKVVLLVKGPKWGAGYYVVDLKTGKATGFSDLYRGVTAKDVAVVRTLTYAASDGMRLPAYLTLPPGRAPHDLPLIVLPHGGPASRDRPGFDWWAQALASRGYAVLQPQFRGSDGFGLQHLEAGYGQWGKAMQTDLSDGVRQLAKDGTIDPNHVCIVGASYGGYAALAGVTLQKDIYRCAVAVAPVADLRRFLQWTRAQRRAVSTLEMRYWTRFMGADGARDPDLNAISPALRAEQASGPILLIHGKDDTVVPFEQSKLMADALTRQGKPVQLVALEGEDHWLSRSDTRLQMLAETVKFLETYNPPNGSLKQPPQQ